ncbi:MAG TPA: hypothetical protein PK595_06875 [Bacteroidota bacterium]|nr:hypothetical protein [Bacteroidota bacterium]
METLTPELLKALSQGGVTILIFVIWFITYKTLSKQYVDQVNKLQEQIQEDLKYKELLTGILTRLETKLDIAIKEIKR